jgi:integrase
MVKAMPDPYIPKHSTYYWYRQRVPTDLKSLAKGKTVLVTVDCIARHLTIGSELKVTLSTKDPAVAKVRARDVQDQFDLIWASVRTAEVTLSHKQAVALAGEVYRDWSVLEENPGSPELWQHVRALNADAKIGRPYKHSLTIGLVDPLEERFGPLVDVVLKRHSLRVDRESRRKVVEQTAKAMDDMANLLELRAEGDYRPDPIVERFPHFEPTSQPTMAPDSPEPGLTFEQIIRAEEEHRRIGLGAKSRPFSVKTARKYLSIANEFADYRGQAGNRADTVTAEELEGWKLTLLTSPQAPGGEPNGRRTVHHKIGNLKTILGWGVNRFKSNAGIKAALGRVKEVELPGFEKKASDISAIRPDEALQVLKAARRTSDARTRWLPWLCAYTGARINEVAKLRREDFLESEGYWFFKLTTSGGRSLKTASSVRYVPVHPTLEAEGFRKFVESTPKGALFGPSADTTVRRWFWDEDGAAISREGVRPSHGWRHLFEDLCIRDGVSDSAKNYITGRVKPGSDQDYGKTLARLPGLHREISKIVPFAVT